ncbi:caspase domain-containing protein [Amylostereum chailletii]|nr:caspase domain-containing protein [Amylostereum chailletii]
MHLNEMEIVPSTSPDVERSKHSRLFALIIGINEYKHHSSTLPNLSGAVRDAEAIKTHLINRMDTPPSRIRELLNKSATRKAIVNEIVGLKTNDAISRNDPILIYFAGHGAEVAAAEGWEAGGKNAKIQMIIPHDYVEGEEDPQAPHGIPDRTIALLLNDLADAKGNNITVIFDSCFAGSGTRAMADPSVRGFVARRRIPSSLDSEVLPVARATRPYALTHGLRSHVLLAACRAGETAHESREGGDFTVALLRALRVVGPSEQLSYKALIQRLSPLPSGQHPLCEGIFQDRILFNMRKNSPSSSKAHALHKVVAADNVITMEAGLAHGVSKGSEYAIYENNNVNLPRLGMLVASSPGTFKTQLDYASDLHRFSIPSPAFALQTHTARSRNDSALKVYVSEDPQLDRLREALAIASNERPPGHRTFTLIPTICRADLNIERVGDNGVRLALLVGQAPSYGLKYTPTLPISDDILQCISHALHSAAHYYWYLHHHPRAGMALEKQVQVSCFKLQERPTIFDNKEQLLLTPDDHRNIVVNRCIDITVNRGDNYGIKLANTSKIPLYPYLFYFNNSDFSIDPLYIPSTGADPPLAADGGTLTIGYGAGGASPISWTLDDGQDLEVGFFRLVFATVYMELSDIPQTSRVPPGYERERTSLQAELSYVPQTSGPQRKRQMVSASSQRQDVWGTVTIPVVQRRPHS